MDNKKKFITCDGNYAASHVAYMYSEVAAIYPITPSSDMGENADQMASVDRKNLFGQTLLVSELQSEGGAAGAVHGALQVGALTTTFTASQGLLLMIPNMYKIAGELIPTVFHVSARSLATSALSIFGDHSDVMAVRQTGFAMMAASSVQHVMDMAVISHNATLEAEVPFLNFFDGFRTSHEIQKIELVDEKVMDEMLDRDLVKKFKDNAMNPYKPDLRGTAENPDIYFQGREGVNTNYNNTPDIVQKWMDKFAEKTGRKYKLFDYFGDPEAERVVIAMGSGVQTIRETVDYLNKNGEKVGVIVVRLYRPFSPKYILKVIPKSAKKIAVLDRTKEPGSVGEPLLVDVRSVLSEARYGMHGEEYKSLDPIVVGGRYGLSSKEFKPSMVKAVFDNLNADLPKSNFTVGINDDVTNLSLTVGDKINILPEDVIQCKFYGMGSDGTVGANKNSIKIIGDNTDNFAQGYFVYDSKKSGGITISHLRFGKSPIKAPYLILDPSFVAVHNEAYLGRYDVLEGIKEGGTFLLNSELDADEIFPKMDKGVQKTIIEKKLKFYAINAVKIAKSIGLGNRTNMIMQSAFFLLSKVLEKDEAVRLSKDAIEKLYSKKGKKIVEMNWKAVDSAEENLVEIKVPSAVIDNDVKPYGLSGRGITDFVKEVVQPVAMDNGDSVPVSKIPKDGRFPIGTAKFEKRSTATEIPIWHKDTCIQCNQCSFSCPHACIRAKYSSDEDINDAPSLFESVKAKAKNAKDLGLNYILQVSPRDCTGCGVCVEVCPTKEKSITMESFNKNIEAEDVKFDFFDALPVGNLGGEKRESVKGTQFLPHYFEYHGACAGCGETPYVNLMTHLFGERMFIANATGCSSIYGGTAPTSVYTIDENGQGPAWNNSLFEDNAEFGYGMAIANRQMRGKVFETMENLAKLDDTSAELKEAMTRLEEVHGDFKESKVAGDALITILNNTKSSNEFITYLKENTKFFAKMSQWIVGGDGWAYDIGYGGLDHVLASGENVNILVLDTEVYSNTGGQASKSTPIGAVAKFAAKGMRQAKKDLGLIAMAYGDVYVASISVGADKNQTIKAFIEAEAYDGPSIILAYSPCIAHGINMSKMMENGKEAADSGYWPMYRFNPELAKENKNPLILKPVKNKDGYVDYIKNQGRYRALGIVLDDDDKTMELFEEASKDADRRMAHLEKLAKLEY